MLETQTEQYMLEETNRCRDRFWLSLDEGEGFVEANPVIDAQFDGKIHTGQKVFLPGDQFIGRITRLFRKPGGQVSYIAVRTARLFGRHKMVPIASVSDVTPLRVLLSIDRDQFMELTGYPTDRFISEEVDRALWKDVVLRDTDYYEIDVQVRDGIITLNGHVITSMNQWRAVTAANNIPGSLGVNSHLIPDDKLTLMVAKALGNFEPVLGNQLFAKVENGLVILIGEVSSTLLRDQAEQCIADIPWVRGIINEIRVTGIVLDPEDQRFLQPGIGKELLFKDGLSVTIQKVIVNPHKRRVVAVVVLGRFPSPLSQELNFQNGEKTNLARLKVLPVSMILHLTRSAGLIRINSTEITENEEYDSSRYITPNQDWLPPYPYCTDEVLFLGE